MRKFRTLLSIAVTAGALAATAGTAQAGWHVVYPWQTNYGTHSIASTYIDYQGGGSFTTCGQHKSSGGYVFATGCGTLDAYVREGVCTNRVTDVIAWTNASTGHNMFFSYYNSCPW